MAKALRHWEQTRYLQKRQCNCLTISKYKVMKKLKKFVLNDAKVLSRDELALVEGSICIDAVDNCTESTIGKACILSTSYDGTHSTVTLGTCMVKYTQVGSRILYDAFCG